MNLHATCIALQGRGVLLTGPSGCGKSDLALRLIEGGALLVADDQVLLERARGQIEAHCPPLGHGMIEARGVGILKLPFIESAPVALVLLPGEPERLPEPQFYPLLDQPVPALTLPYLEASTPAKIRLWLQHEYPD